MIQVPGEAEPRVVTRDIPETLGDMVEQAGKDNNHLQKKVNVHESAFTWVRRYKTSKSKSERRRLQDLLLPGSSAVFTVVPSSPRMRVGHEAYTFTICQRFLCQRCCARGTTRQLTSWCSSVKTTKS